MNRFECIGRLTKDPELTITNAEISVAKFSIAVDRKFKKEDGTHDSDFFNCVAWRGIGKTINKYCKKGDKIFIAGELQNRSYDASDGTKRYVTEVIVNDCEFLETKSNNEEQKTELTPVEDDNLPF